MKYAPTVAQNLETKLSNLPKVSFESFSGVQYYRGGFEPKMTRREAALILGISPNANKLKIKEAHKRIMIINHPDRGGSPYIATKLNEAKDLLDTNKWMNEWLVVVVVTFVLCEYILSSWIEINYYA